MICNKCGNETGNEKFCGYCGNQMPDFEPSTNPNISVPPQGNNIRFLFEKYKKPVIIGAAALVVLIIMLAAGGACSKKASVNQADEKAEFKQEFATIKKQAKIGDYIDAYNSCSYLLHKAEEYYINNDDDEIEEFMEEVSVFIEDIADETAYRYYDNARNYLNDGNCCRAREDSEDAKNIALEFGLPEAKEMEEFWRKAEAAHWADEARKEQEELKENTTPTTEPIAAPTATPAPTVNSGEKTYSDSTFSVEYPDNFVAEEYPGMIIVMDPDSGANISFIVTEDAGDISGVKQSELEELLGVGTVDYFNETTIDGCVAYEIGYALDDMTYIEQAIVSDDIDMVTITFTYDYEIPDATYDAFLEIVESFTME